MCTEAEMSIKGEDPYGVKETQEYYLPIMDLFHSYCLKHDIRYSLSGGSLLGAVRHQGFIPWDDDMDVMFDRKNYEKFMSCFRIEPMDGCEIVGSQWVMRISRKDNPLKDQEKQCIDMFVFDPIPAGRFLAGFKKLVIFTLQGMMKRNVDYSRYSFGNRILVFGTHLLGLFVSQKRKLKMYHRVSQWKGSGESGLLNVYNVFFAYVGRTRYKQEILSGYTMLDFEGRKYMSVAGYDSYLTELYGDYMKLPPEADRNSSHEVE